MNKSHFFYERKNVEKKSVVITIIKDIHVIDNFKINFLIKMSILDSKEIIINFFLKKIFTRYQNVLTLIQFII